MGGPIGTSRVLCGLDFKDKPWAAMGNSFGFLEPRKMTSPHVRHVGKEAVTRSRIDEYAYPQICDLTNNNIRGVKVGFGF